MVSEELLTGVRSFSRVVAWVMQSRSTIERELVPQCRMVFFDSWNS